MLILLIAEEDEDEPVSENESSRDSRRRQKVDARQGKATLLVSPPAKPSNQGDIFHEMAHTKHVYLKAITDITRNSKIASHSRHQRS